MASLDPRRSGERVYFEKGTTVTVSNPSGYRKDEMLLNMSSEGLGVLSSSGLYEGDSVKLQFEAIGKRFVLEGDVRRVSGKEVFIKFKNVDEYDQERIDKLIFDHGKMRR